MKNKIAVFANGWSDEIVSKTLNGIKRCAEERGADIFMFISHSSFGTEGGINSAYNSIFKLPQMDEYDGCIMLSNVLNLPQKDVETISRRPLDAGIPVISIGMDLPGCGFARSDNEIGMRDLALHLYRDKGVKRTVYVGGAIDHPDCQTRLRIASMVAEEYGQTIEADDIYFSDWSFVQGEEIAAKILASPKGLPDAIVCANDYLALAIASGLLNGGVSLPGDVLLTGYDHVQDGQDFYPALTTVGQDYESTGYRACNWLYDTLEGKHPDRVLKVESCFVPGESTCGTDESYDCKRRQIGQHAYIKTINESLLESREGLIEGAILGRKKYDDLVNVLRWHYEGGKRYEGESFYCILEKDFIQSAYERRIEGSLRYEDERLVLVGIRDKKELGIRMITAPELIPAYRKDETSHFYCLAPMHVDKQPIGYIVFVDNYAFLRQRKINVYAGRIQQALERFRNNLYIDGINEELRKISITDSLTGLDNRLSYSQRVEPLFEENKAKRHNLVIGFFDINFMKIINDRFGHLQGDLAIRTVGTTIRKNIPQSWIALRYGGDEFMVVGDISDGLDPSAVEKQIEEGVKKAHERMSLPYELTVSYGHCITDMSSGKELIDYIKEADIQMYLMKEEIHRQHLNV